MEYNGCYFADKRGATAEYTVIITYFRLRCCYYGINNCYVAPDRNTSPEGDRQMKDLLKVADSLEFKGAVIEITDHPCFSGRRKRKKAVDVSDDTSGDDIADDSSADDSSADDSSSDDWDIMDDNCDDD